MLKCHKRDFVGPVDGDYGGHSEPAIISEQLLGLDGPSYQGRNDAVEKNFFLQCLSGPNKSAWESSQAISLLDSTFTSTTLLSLRRPVTSSPLDSSICVRIRSGFPSERHRDQRTPADPPPIRSTTETLYPIKVSRERTNLSGPWLRYPTASSNTSSSLSPHVVIKLRFVVRLSSSYLVDPQWARKFTAIWTSVAAVSVLVSLPRLYKYAKQGRAFTGAFGVTELWKTKQYFPAEERQPRKCGNPRKFWIGIGRARAVSAWTLPGFDVSVGQSERRFRPHLRQLSHNSLQCY